MSKVTIKFWDTARCEYVGSLFSDDFSVNENNTVIHIYRREVTPHLEPHFFKDGERIA